MPWIPPVLAHVDQLGRIFCVRCSPELTESPIHGDQWFGEDDKCERCLERLEHVPTSRYIHVS